MRRRLPVVLLLAAPLAFAPGCGKSGARPEVVLYCSADQTVAEPIIEAFERQAGVDVQARFDTEASKTAALVARLRSEASRPVADVFWSSEVFHTIRLAREGFFAAKAVGGGDERPEHLIDRERRWYGFALRARVVAYHTGRVATNEIPMRLEDLLEARWKGRLVMAAPEFGTTSGHMAALFVHYGPARAREILHGLKRNETRLVDGNSTAVRFVATGQADACLTDTDDVYAAQRNGWPIAMNYLRHGDAGPLVIPNSVAIIAGAPHPDAATVLARFLLGEETERLLAASDSHNTPVRASVARAFPRYAVEDPLPVEYSAVADRLNEAVASARSILR